MANEAESILISNMIQFDKNEENISKNWILTNMENKLYRKNNTSLKIYSTISDKQIIDKTISFAAMKSAL